MDTSGGDEPGSSTGEATGSSAAGEGSGSSGSGGAPDPGAAPGVRSVYVVPDPAHVLLRDATFFDHPWPSDLRRDTAGKVRFSGYPNPRQQPFLAEYIDSMEGVLDGFSPAASGYVRFEGPIDPASLPGDPLAALAPTSAVQLIDVDPNSPTRGQRKRISLRLRAEPGVYWPANTLAFAPTFGFPLRGATQHALVVTDAARAADGGPVQAAEALQAVLGLAHAEGPAAAAREELAAALAEVEAAGVERGRIVHLAVFTTADPTAETRTIRDWVHAEFPAPTVLPGSWSAQEHIGGLLDVYEGVYGPSPDFQGGELPFLEYGDGGALSFDAEGVPVVQREVELRFALAVPGAGGCPMPKEGYPIVVYAHGSGGHYRSMLGKGDEAESLAARCMATIGIDQLYHGARPGGECGEAPPPCNHDPEMAFFNVMNPTAARANGPQAAIDVVQQARLITVTKLVVPAEVSRTGTELRFDPARVLFMGHSQGGLNGSIFLGIDDQARGGVLSAAGSMISISLLEKKAPFDIPSLVMSTILGLAPAEYGEVDLFHPALSLAQSIVDASDPIHYVGMIARHPRPGFTPKSAMMTEGVNPDASGDSFTPPRTIEVGAVALGLPPQNPVIHAVAELPWSDLEPVTIPPEGLSGNLAGGLASGVLAQWPASLASDGHFVIYEIPAAMAQAVGFLRNLADDPKSRVPAP